MDAQVTQEMVDAAQRELPGVWNQARVRRALTAALALQPDPTVIDLPIRARVHIHLDTAHLETELTEALERAAAGEPITDLAGRVLAVYGADIPQPGRQPTMDARIPVLNPALEHPLELGSLAEFGRRVGVARSTVSGWVKQRETNGMPGPVDGDVYDLRALADWHAAWKGGR